MEFIDNLTILCSELSNCDKTVRRKALNEIDKCLFKTPMEENCILDALNLLEVELVARLSDESEINRTIAGSLIYNFCSRMVVTDRLLSILIPVISNRFNGPSIEESEDVKILLLNIVNVLASNNIGKKLLPYFDNLIDITKVSLCDKCPDILLKSCEFICNMSFCLKEKFSMRSDNLTNGLVKTLSSQRFRVRSKAIEALGCILVNGVVHSIDDVIGPLYKCSMDICHVRLTLISTGYFVSTKMENRYSYWKKILPLLLFGLRDEDNDIRSKTCEFWRKVGEQYMEENKDSGLLMQSDFTEYYPSNEMRFGIGCRTLASNIVGSVLPVITFDMGDWQVDARFHASKLLTILILNIEQDCIQYADGMLQTLFSGILDQDQRIVKECFTCAQYLGYFLPPDLYITILDHHADENPEATAKILLSLFEGTPPPVFERHICSIVMIIEDLTCYLDLVNDPYVFLEILQVIIKKVNFKEIPFSLVIPLLRIMGSTNPQLKKKVTLIFNELAVKCGKNSYEEMVSGCVKKILNILRKEENFWTKDSANMTLFSVLSKFDGFEDYFDLVIPLLSKHMRKNEAPFVTFMLLQSMKAMIERISLGKPIHALKWATFVIKYHINPLLPWSAGDTLEGLRTAALSALLSILKNFSQNGKFFSVLSDCVNLLPTLIKDDSKDTRILVCSFIQSVCTHFPSLITNLEWINFMHLLVSRLEDSCIDCRRVAAISLSNVSSKIIEKGNSTDKYMIKDGSNIESDEHLSMVLEQKMDLESETKSTLEVNTGEDFDYMGSLVELIPIILPYLDEQDQEIQEHLLDTLQNIGKSCPENLIQELEDNGAKFRNSNLCLGLLKQLKEANLEKMDSDTELHSDI